MSTAHRLPVELKCPACGARLSGVINPADEYAPADGDRSICGYCRALLIYSGPPANSLRYPTEDEQREMLADPDVQRGIATVADLHRRHGAPPPPQM